MTTTAPRRTAVDPRDIRRAPVTATAVLRAALEYPMSTQIAQDLDKMLDSLEAARNVIDRRMNALRIARDSFVADTTTNGQVKAHKRGRGSGNGGPILAVARKRFRGGQITPDSLSEAAGIQARHAMVWLGQQLRRGNLTRVSRGVYRLSGGAK